MPRIQAPARGRRTGVKVQIPPAQLPSRTVYTRGSHLLSASEVTAWNERNHALLSQYGLTVAAVSVLPLDVAGATAGPSGDLQGRHRDRILLAAMLGALAVSARGRGDLLALPQGERDARKIAIKENNDRNSTAAMTEALHSLCAAEPGIRLRIAIGEGARLKPGERGGNPTLYAGQVFGAGARAYNVAVDTVEGTTKSTLFDHSSGTLLFVTESEILPVPDVYFDKCQLKGIDGVTVADPLDRIVEAVMDTRGTHEINIFALDRPRHPIEQMMALGANMRIDTDGDAYPVAAAGLSWGVFPDNLRPLDGVCGNIGGAAEMLASAAGGHYLGVRTTARFCARKIRSWEERYGFAPGEEDALKAAGFDPARVYRIEELIPGLTKSDGVLVAAAITDNWHVPGMDACWIGGNYAAVTALFIGSAGTADLYRVVFTYPAGLDATAEALTPIVTRLLGLPAGDIPAAVLAALADPASARRLRNELGTSFYSHLRPGGKTAAASTRLALDIESAAKVESASATALLRAVMRAAPDWFE